MDTGRNLKRPAKDDDNDNDRKREKRDGGHKSRGLKAKNPTPPVFAPCHRSTLSRGPGKRCYSAAARRGPQGATARLPEYWFVSA